MHRRYDPSYSSSGASSLLSESQPVTRASSTTAVTTPEDEVPGGYRYDRKPSDAEASSYLKRVRARSAMNNAGPDVEPYGPYFSLPPDPTSDAPPLVRRPTTRELIGRYESMTSTTSGRSSGKASSLEFPQRNTTSKTSTEDKKGKGRSPIRQSFRNLLSVFSKKGKLSRDSTAATLVSESSSGMAIELKKPSPFHIPTASELPLIKENVQTPACTSPMDLHSGTLLHLCYPDTKDAFPVWTECNVILHPSHILITWHTNLGNPSTSIITFEQCTDVRSLGLADLDPTERTLLPTAPDDLKPFELLFEGRAREKFAAVSVKERAGWVSAIWDAVLKTNEEKMYTPSLQNPHSTVDNSRHASPQPVFSPHPVPSPQPVLNHRRNPSPQSFAPEQSTSRPSSVARSSYHADRDLPALPQEAPAPRSPARFELYDPPVPQHISVPSTPTKSTYLEVPTPPRSQSPSIRNLDQRSVVKQRLAEIERTASIRSASASPEKSTRSRQVLGSTYSPTSAHTPLSIRTTGPIPQEHHRLR
ncbi:hypothetical protein NM688_g7343 [Phlebia brevispora]|uniref:Uncharacterized protein n=1 Tax=Phlebia brevispora TaxID=194682 RepID=A0ACC1S690_9APHY|nr:hypothetical protein NM688_g7343 [Phlebia brevispora]